MLYKNVVSDRHGVSTLWYINHRINSRLEQILQDARSEWDELQTSNNC